ncbi:MAG TPA: mechanosensitive ion channel domain-containing protein [Anaeromyxobacteraceae bacterium]|nr:mechanosensitive ion channel domain-containing protein [Anaeromyxobacteraceae bacterium]
MGSPACAVQSRLRTAAFAAWVAVAVPDAAWAQAGVLAAAARAPAPAPASPSPPPAEQRPAAIPVPLVVGAAEEALIALRAISRQLQEDGGGLGAAAGDDAALRQTLVALRARAKDPALATATTRALFDLGQEIDRVDLQVRVREEVLRARALGFQAATEDLARMRAIWALTAEVSARADAPALVLDRVGTVRARIASVEEGLRDALERLARRQAEVASLRDGVADAQESLRQARRTVERLLLEAESAPLWSAFGRGMDAQAARHEAAATAASLRRYLAQPEARSGAQVAFFLAATLGLWFLGRGARRLGASHERGSPARVLEHPVPAAMLLALLGTGVFHPTAPSVYRQLGLFAALPVFLLVTRGVVDAEHRAPLLSLAGLFALDRLSDLVLGRSLPGRLGTLSAALGGVALAWAGLRPGGWAHRLGTGPYARGARRGVGFALAALALAVVANVVGNVTLGDRMARGVLLSALGGVLAAGLVLVLRSAAYVLLRLEGVRRLRVVERHGELVERRLRTALQLAAAGIWTVYALGAFDVQDLAFDAAAAVLGHRLKVGSLDISAGDVLAFAVTLGCAILLARLLAFLLDEAVMPRLDLPRGVSDAISTTARYAVVGLGTLAAVYASGIDLSRFGLLAGTLGVGIGFGLQNIVNNFVSGLILIYERPINIGDVIEVGKVTGEVRRIGVRSSTIRTFQGSEVIVPNGNLISTEVVNWTLTDRTRRVEIAVSVAYGSDPEEVRRLLLATLEGRTDLLATPAPVVLLQAFGDSSLDFELRFWPARFDDAVTIASEVRAAILRALGGAGIEIPFPQRDLRVRTGGADLLQALARQNVAVAAGGASAPSPERVDAPQPAAGAQSPAPAPAGERR